MAKILVVEDEPDLRELIIDQLDDAGHSTLEAANGEEGLAQLVKTVPDMVISDITMPVMNGYQFLRTLKEKHPEHGHIPFLFLSALAERDDQLKGLRLGVDDYLTKPIDFEILIARVDARLRSHQAPVAAPSTDQPAKPHAQPDNERDGTKDQASSAAAQKLCGLVDQSSGNVVVGKVQTLSLEKIRERMGDRWSEVADKILRNAEQIIHAHVGKDDVVHLSPDRDFLIGFADLDAAQTAAKVELIRDEIWERLFGETQDHVLSSVTGETHAVTLDRQTMDQRDSIFDDIERKITSTKVDLNDGDSAKVEKIYRFEDLSFAKLATRSGSLAKIRRLDFFDGIRQRIETVLKGNPARGDLLLSMESLLLERLEDEIQRNRIGSEIAIIIPVDFSMIADAANRKKYISILKAFEQRSRRILIVEIVNLPDRLLQDVDTLQPLPVGRQIQFLEIRKPEQLDGVDLAPLRIGFLSMDYAHASRHGAKGLAALKSKFDGGNVKFHVKNIPEGKLIEAQNLGADLYSTSR